MRTPLLTPSVFAVAFGLLADSPALPQQMTPMDDASMHTIHQPYDVETFGAFRRIMMAGDFSPKTRLDAVMAKHPTTGVGALAEARGEITIYDGKLIVSYGKDGAPADANSQSAALLATGSVAGWQSVRVEQDVTPEDVESYIAVAAKTHGIDPDASFPFEVRGNIGPYAMHVNAAPTVGSHGMGMPVAETIQHQGERLDGLIAGLYVSQDLMGIATHGGERTHAHWVALDQSATAHLDHWGLKAGAILLLPKPK